MTNIIDYKIITGNSDIELQVYVRQVIAEGWQPLGGVSIGAFAEGTVLAQAMVKYAPEEGVTAEAIAQAIMNAPVKPSGTLSYMPDYSMDTTLVGSNFNMPRDFATEQDAIDWIMEDVDNLYVDNGRFAFLDDLEAMKKYNEQKARGCCGEADETVTVNGRLATVGCNYGH